MLYHPPLSPPSIRHVALASRTFRVFGLDDPAWKNAGESRRRASRNGGDEGSAEEDEGGEEDEADKIWDAVKTALSEDAGGHGTAGFHPVSSFQTGLGIRGDTGHRHARPLPARPALLHLNKYLHLSAHIF